MGIFFGLEFQKCVVVFFFATMGFIDVYEDFEKAAERVYLNSPMKARCVMKYDHSNACLQVKVTDDAVCVQYKTDSQEQLKKLEKLVGNLMKHMASSER